MPETRMVSVRRAGGSLLARAGELVRSYTVGPAPLRDDGAYFKFLTDAGLQPTASGVHVSAAEAFTYSAVFDAVNQIASDVAKVPLNLRKYRQSGGSDLYEKSNLYWLLKWQANEDMTSFVFRRSMMVNALTMKGAFAEIERDGTGRPYALWPIMPERVQPFIDTVTLANGAKRSRMRYRIDGGAAVIKPENMLHLHGLSRDGYSGHSLIHEARQAIGLALAAERFGAAFFGNGTTFGGVLSTDAAMSPEWKTDTKANIEAFHRGVSKAHQFLVLTGGVKYQKLGVSPNESQMNELRDKQIEEVARFFNIPIHKLKVSKPGAVSYASVEAAETSYLSGCLMNWYVNIEQEWTRKLIPSLELGNQFIKHNVNAFMRGDSTSRAAFYTAMLGQGVYCADDVLELEDQNPQPNGQGKLYLVQGAMVPKDQIADVVKAGIESKSRKNTPPPSPVPAADPNPDAARMVDFVMARAERAEQAAEAMRAETDALRQRLAVAETSGAASIEEVASLRAAVEQASAVSMQTTALAESLRGDVVTQRELAEQRRVDAEAERARAAQVAVDLDQARIARAAADEALAVTAAELATAHDAGRDAAALAAHSLALSEAAQGDARAARALADSAEEVRLASMDTARLADAGRADAEQRAAAALAAQRAAEDESNLAVAAVDEAIRRRSEAEQERDAARAGLADVEQRAAVALEAAERRVAEARAGQGTAETALEALRTEASESAQRAARAEGERDAAIQERIAAEQRTDLAHVDLEAARELSAESGRLAAAAETRAVAAERLAEEARAAVTAAGADRVAALVAAEIAEDTARRARAEATQAEDARLTASQMRDDARAQLASLDSSLVEANDRAAVAARDAAAARAELESVARLADAARAAQESATAAMQAALVVLEQERVAARASVEVAEARLAERGREADALQNEVRTVRQADAGALTATIEAHRDLVADIMARMVSREAEQARRAQADPRRLEKWLETFYEAHGELMQRALLPAVRVHLAFTRSSEEAHDLTRRLVEAHVRQSERELRAVIDGDAPEWGASVTSLLNRWEQDRPAVIAATLMKVEIEYARSI